MEFHAWEVHRNVERYVDVIGDQVERDTGNNLDDLTVVEARRAQGLDIRVRYLPMVLDQF
jgi:hypothetical protein